jgi:charged multivesicular body protein 2A
MEWMFGKKLTPDEMLRKNQRALNKVTTHYQITNIYLGNSLTLFVFQAMRDLDREKMKMEQQEKKIIADIKKLAKENQIDAVKIMAKDLVRTRRSTRKFMLMKANIQAVSLKIQTLKSQNTMAQAMKGKEIGRINIGNLK